MTEEIKFHGGKWLSALPMMFFIIWAISICVTGTPDTKGLILGILIGLTLTMFFVKSKWSNYCEKIFEGMASEVGVIAIACWFWAGIFAQVLRTGGLVDGLVWLGQTANVTGGLLIGLTFLLSSLFATAVGTGYGTVVAFCTLMYPAGIKLGADPLILFASILSGAAFGDNLAPVSDTTIISAVTQETDIPGVVKSRFKYAITAAVPTLILFIILGGIRSEPITSSVQETASTSPEGLILLVPFFIVVFLAMSGRHIIVSLSLGIIASIITIYIFQLTALSNLLYFDVENRAVGGAVIDGFMGYLEMAILILLILASGHIMKVGGAMKALKNIAFKFIKSSLRKAELAIWAFVTLLNLTIIINTAAEITAAPFVSEIGKEFKIHPYRRANFLDATSSALGYIFPWSGGVLIGYATLTELAETAPELPIIAPTEVWPFVFHGWFLLVVMFLAALTGIGRKMK